MAVGVSLQRTYIHTHRRIVVAKRGGPRVPVPGRRLTFSFFLRGPIDTDDLFWIIFSAGRVCAPFLGKKMGIRADRCMAFW